MITTEKHTNQFLKYCVIHPNATIRFYISDILLKIHSDESYMSENNTRSTTG